MAQEGSDDAYESQTADEYAVPGAGDFEAQDAPTELTIAVGGPSGSAVSSTHIAVCALVPSSDSDDLFFQPVGSGTTAANGSATISLNRGELSPSVKDGEVELRVTASDPRSDARCLYTIPLRITGDSRMIVNTNGREGSLTSFVSSAAETNISDLRLSQDVAAPSLESFTEDNEVYEAPTATPDAKPPPRKCAFPEAGQLRYSGYSSKKWMNVKSLETPGSSSVSFAWSRSHSTMWSVISNAKFAEFSASQQQTEDTGVVFTRAPNSDVHAELEWTYRRYDIMCRDLMMGLVRADSGKDECRAHAWTGRNHYVQAPGTGVTCKDANRTSTVGKTGVTRDTTATYVSSLSSLGGVSLKQQQTAGEKTSVTVLPSSGKTTRICGSDTIPIRAKMIKEVA